jgi:hypothetical protein
MDQYLGVAKEEGITDDEIGAVQSIVMAVWLCTLVEWPPSSAKCATAERRSQNRPAA